MRWLGLIALLYACEDSASHSQRDCVAAAPADAQNDSVGKGDGGTPVTGGGGASVCTCDGGQILDGAQTPDSGQSLDSGSALLGEGGIPVRSERDLVSFVYRNGSIHDTNWTVFTVEPPGSITFEDAMISQRKQLMPAEYRMVLDYVLSSEFIDAVRRPMNPDCVILPDATQGMIVTWSNVGAQSVTLGACGMPLSSDHVYARLVTLMWALQSNHLTCDAKSPGFCR